MEPEYIGQRLLERGFRVWFKYMFRLVENRIFIEEDLHEGLFEIFEDLHSLKIDRQTLNIPPRSAKTTVAIYFIAYSLAINPRCNFIYTSFSQDLLKENSAKLSSILQHKGYQTMYGNSQTINDFEDDPINDFWKQYLEENSGKAKYSSRIIKTEDCGNILFASIGSAITGFGAGIRGEKRFSGALIIDDPNKPADIRSETMRDKVKRYYEETLISRLNQSDVPILNIQQRLHLEDLSGILKDVYNFKVLSRPLIDDKGKCLLPSQYTKRRILEIQKNDYLFQSQYQQNPIKLGGNVIKSEWFNYYPIEFLKRTKFQRLFWTADTAQKTKEHNDWSVFAYWGLFEYQLYLIDLIRGKWEAPELKRQAIKAWNKHKLGINGRFQSGMYIEDKVSGTGLIQSLRNESVIAIPVPREKDKLMRLSDVSPLIESGKIFLPESPNYGFNPVFISECEAFTKDDSHKWDDQVDTLIDAIDIAIGNKKPSILDNI